VRTNCIRLHPLPAQFTPTQVGSATSQPGPAASQHRFTPHEWGVPLGGWGQRGAELSMPRAWGVLVAEQAEAKAVRFTPACAGEVPPAGPSGRPGPVHPRARGRWHRRGSGGLRGRFTPACAGTISGTPWSPTWCAVHPPHVWDRFLFSRLALKLLGSTPRAQGRCPHRPPGSPRRRFTPTCAGTV